MQFAVTWVLWSKLDSWQKQKSSGTDLRNNVKDNRTQTWPKFVCWLLLPRNVTSQIKLVTSHHCYSMVKNTSNYEKESLILRLIFHLFKWKKLYFLLKLKTIRNLIIHNVLSFVLTKSSRVRLDPSTNVAITIFLLRNSPFFCLLKFQLFCWKFIPLIKNLIILFKIHWYLIQYLF